MHNGKLLSSRVVRCLWRPLPLQPREGHQWLDHLSRPRAITRQICRFSGPARRKSGQRANRFMSHDRGVMLLATAAMDNTPKLADNAQVYLAISYDAGFGS